jgi:hypothetical protein
MWLQALQALYALFSKGGRPNPLLWPQQQQQQRSPAFRRAPNNLLKEEEFWH